MLKTWRKGADQQVGEKIHVSLNLSRFSQLQLILIRQFMIIL